MERNCEFSWKLSNGQDFATPMDCQDIGQLYLRRQAEILFARCS